jgi:hypothetical protein
MQWWSWCVDFTELNSYNHISFSIVIIGIRLEASDFVIGYSGGWNIIGGVLKNLKWTSMSSKHVAFMMLSNLVISKKNGY